MIDASLVVKIPSFRVETIDPGAEIETRANGAEVRFSPLHVRPGQRVDLPVVHLLAPEHTAGGEVALDWTLTSADADGVQAGQLILDIEPEVVDLALAPSSSRI
jgi:hypothetical protein